MGVAIATPFLFFTPTASLPLIQARVMLYLGHLPFTRMSWSSIRWLYVDIVGILLENQFTEPCCKNVCHCRKF